ncbi:c-type cytochrome [Pararhodospirillum oryzae]|uniref:Cytochrome c2 n=1 Tax=Pararhodospirillum oryzae TaxID=478448 RepID=A0A512HBV9_9PROT|nr:c-type cytochrome [Pararhodospirillum oryzae]GEO82932.1 cytochrome c2 [Pararhodospirillum oryzae]
MNKGILAAGVIAAVALVNGTAFAAGDAAAGAEVSKKCLACHTLGKGEPNKVGPNLFGVYGRVAGTHEGYNYSESYKEMGQKGLTWEEANLKGYLADPLSFVRAKSGDDKGKSKMTFRLTKDDEIANVIAFLMQNK